MKSKLLSCVAAFLLVTTPAFSADLHVEVHFTSDEASIIRAFYEQGRAQKKPPGKGNRSLPPGIAKNLDRGKPLPPGIAKQVLPTELIGRLPPVRDGFERVIVDGKVVLIEIATQVIHDVLTDIILK